VGGHDAREETDNVALEDHERAEGIGGDDRRDVARAPDLLQYIVEGPISRR
jgi:hypothetical protein